MYKILYHTSIVLEKLAKLFRGILFGAPGIYRASKIITMVSLSLIKKNDRREFVYIAELASTVRWLPITNLMYDIL